MRDSGRCRRCHETRVGLLESLPDGTSREPSYRALGTIIGELQSLENHYNYQLYRNERTLNTFAKGAEIKSGSIEAVVCTRCGCVDLYVQDPQWTPFRQLSAFRASDHPAGPTEDSMWHGARCPRCASDKTGKLQGLPDTVGKETQVRQQAVGADEHGELRGRLEALVCTSCGFMELLVADPKSLDFETLEGFSWLSPPDGAGPYR